MKLAHKIITPLALSLALFPGIANALLADGDKLTGLDPNTTYVLVLDDGATTEAQSDEKGIMFIRSDDDRDIGTLKYSAGSGRGTLKNKITGEPVGDLDMEDGVLTVSSAYGFTPRRAASPEINYGSRAYMAIGVNRNESDETGFNVDLGRMAAMEQGFSTIGSADDNALGLSFGLGFAIGDEDAWNDAGSVQWHFMLNYARYEETEGEFSATQEGVTLRSMGSDEVSSLGLSFGPHMYLCDRFAVLGELGFTAFRSEGSGNIREESTGTLLESFSDNRVDGTGTFTLGAKWDLTEKISLRGDYTWSFDDTGSSKMAKSEVMRLMAELRL